MRPLIIDQEQKLKIAKVIEYAEKNPYPKIFLLNRVKKKGTVPGDDPNFYCKIPVGFKCVYTVEEHPCGWCRHLSISVDDPDKVPNIAAIEFLMKEFGFKSRLESCFYYVEDDISPKAVNIIEKK